jgi:hypothetical protein
MALQFEYDQFGAQDNLLGSIGIAVLLAPYLAPLKGFPIMYNHPALVDLSKTLINNPD